MSKCHPVFPPSFRSHQVLYITFLTVFEFCTSVVSFQKQRWKTSEYLNYLEAFSMSNMNFPWDKLYLLPLPCPQQIRTSTTSLYSTFTILCCFHKCCLSSLDKKSQQKQNPKPKKTNISPLSTPFPITPLGRIGAIDLWHHYPLDTNGFKTLCFFQESSPKLGVISITGEYF